MAMTADDFVTVVATGITIASGATTSAVTAIPTCQNGVLPVKIIVRSTQAASIRLGIAGVVATANDTMVQPGDAVRLRVPRGLTSFAVIQQTVGGLVQVSPCEDA
jgi:hypothetical protein